MVTTNRQIIEKMLGRRLTQKEFTKLNKIPHIDALKWAQSQAEKEGRTPGYKKRYI